MDSYLQHTHIINKDNILVKNKATEITADAKTDQDKAVQIHNYVRDQIQFGWTLKFYQMSADQVLKCQIGYSQTKGSLFVALLRSVGIPARLHFVGLNKDIVQGFTDTGNSTVDHAYSEVYLNDKWINTDSYIVDKDLYEKAQRKLQEEKKEMGYGIHIDGTIEWDGAYDSFVQCVQEKKDGGAGNMMLDYGIFADVSDFYGKIDGVDKLTGMWTWFPSLSIKCAYWHTVCFRKDKK